MTADTPYKIMQFIINKFQNGNLTPDNFNIVINQAQRGFLSYLLGQFQQYQPMRPVPKVAWGMNQETRQSLTPLIDAPTTLNISSAGLVNYPDDYEMTDAMYTTAMDMIRFVQQDHLSSFLKSTIDPINTNPLYLIYSAGFQFYPNINYNSTALSQAKLSYVKTPTDIVWAYILDGNGRPVYSQGGGGSVIPTTGSVDPLWYDADMMDIIARALRMVGVNLQANEVSQYAEEIKNTGQ